MKYADLIIPGGASNELAKNILTQNLMNLLEINKEKQNRQILEDGLTENMHFKDIAN